MMTLLLAASAVASDNDDEYKDDERYQTLIKLYDELVNYSSYASNVIVKKNGKMGVVDEDNKLFVPLQYDSISTTWFPDGFFIFKQGQSCYGSEEYLEGFMDIKGNVVIPAEWDELEIATNRDKTYFIVGRCEDPIVGLRSALLDSCGKIIVPPLYGVLQTMSNGNDAPDDTEGRIVAKDAGTEKLGALDFYGNVKVPFVYDDMFGYHKQRILVKKDEKYGVIDGDGNVVVPIKWDGMVYNLGEHMIAFAVKEETDKWKIGFYDFDGKPLSDDVFSAVEPEPLSGYYVLRGESIIMNIGNFNEGMAFFRYGYDSSTPGGYIDTRGQVVIEPQYAEGKPFNDGMAAVKIGETWGYINRTGKMVIPAIYSDAEDFKAGLAIVHIWDKQSSELTTSVLNKLGKTVFTSSAYTVIVVVDEKTGKPLIMEKELFREDTKYYDSNGRLVKVYHDGRFLFPADD